MMRTLAIAGLVAGALIFIPTAAPGTQTLDRVVAVVGQGVILESELDSAVEQIRRRMGRDVANVPEDVLRSQVLDQLILTRLQTQRAEAAGLRVSDNEVRDALERLARQNGMSVEAFQQALRADGMDVADLRDRLRDELLISKLRQREIHRRTQVTEEDIDRYLESEKLRVQEDREYRIRHILVAVSDDASEQKLKSARERIEALRRRALDGETFSDLAIAHSDGQKALQGGDMGWMSGAYLPTVFSEVVPALQPGEISQVFRSPSGFHLIKLVDERSASRGGEESNVIEEIKLRHILLQLNEIRDNERAKALATELRNRIEAGAEFSELAREYSDDAGSANQGGELGWVRPAGLPAGFAEKLRELKASEISQPFRTAQGWHIVELQDRRQRDSAQERQREKARQAIARRKIEEETQAWLRQIRDEAYVEIRMDGYRGDSG